MFLSVIDVFVKGHERSNVCFDDWGVGGIMKFYVCLCEMYLMTFDPECDLC